MNELEKYDPDRVATCVKCGNKDVPYTRYNDRYDEMRRVCTKCGYVYKEAPLNANIKTEE